MGLDADDLAAHMIEDDRFFPDARADVEHDVALPGLVFVQPVVDHLPANIRISRGDEIGTDERRLGLLVDTVAVGINGELSIPADRIRQGGRDLRHARAVDGAQNAPEHS